MAQIPPSVGVALTGNAGAVGGDLRGRAAAAVGATGGGQRGTAGLAGSAPATVVDRRGIVALCVRCELDAEALLFRPGTATTGEARLLPVIPRPPPALSPHMASAPPPSTGPASREVAVAQPPAARPSFLARAMDLLSPERASVPSPPPVVTQTQQSPAGEHETGTLVGARDGQLVLRTATALVVAAAPAVDLPEGAEVEISWIGKPATHPETDALLQSALRLASPIRPTARPPASLDTPDAATDLPEDVASPPSPGRGERAGPAASATSAGRFPSLPEAPPSPVRDQGAASAAARPVATAPPLSGAMAGPLPSSTAGSGQPQTTTPVAPLSAMMDRPTGNVPAGSITSPTAMPPSATPPSTASLPTPATPPAVTSPMAATPGAPISDLSPPPAATAAAPLPPPAATISSIPPDARPSPRGAALTPVAPTSTGIPSAAPTTSRPESSRADLPAALARPPVGPTTMPAAAARQLLAAYGPPASVGSLPPLPPTGQSPGPAAQSRAETIVPLSAPAAAAKAEPTSSGPRLPPGPLTALPGQADDAIDAAPRLAESIGRAAAARESAGATAAGPGGEPRPAQPDASGLGAGLGRLMELLDGKVMAIDGEEEGRRRRAREDEPERIALELELTHLGTVRLELAWSRREISFRLIGQLPLDGAERAALLRDVGQAIQDSGVPGRLVVLDEPAGQ